jgi:cellulose synthase operon protein C
MLCWSGVRRLTFALIGSLLGFSFSLSLPARAVLWPSTIERIERELQAPDAPERRRAAQSLRELPQSSGARLARAALDDADVEVRLTALDACLAFGVPHLGEHLVPWLSDGERRLRLAAAEALAESPALQAVPSLGRTLGDADAGVRSAAANALGKSGAPEAALSLLGHLDDSAPEVRRDVARALGELGDARAVVPLIGKIQDTRPIVREGVAEALAQLGDARAVSALVLSLHDADDSVRVAALEALSRIAEPSSVPSISGLLSSSTDRVRSAALSALSHIHTPAALKTLVEELATDDPGRPRAEVVRALGRVGAAALPVLQACLSAESDPDRLDGCALALGQTQDLAGAAALREALGRGALRPLAALQALADLRAPDSLPTVLEYLSDADTLVRRAAIAAAKALLDPRHPDGRAVEPIARALQDARNQRAEQSELLELLGQTGAPRAARTLLPFAASGDDVPLRARALSALGFLGEAGQVPTLLSALDDDGGSVRLAAGIALGRLSLVGRESELLARLQTSSDRNRSVLTLALGGLASHTRDPSVAVALEKMLGLAQGGERDALLELLGRVPTKEAVASMARLVASSQLPADLAKFAEALAAHPVERGRLVPLLSNPSGIVRANAAWSLGEVGAPVDVPGLERALADPDANVAGNALQALARIAARHQGHIAAQACPRLAEPRPILRALALRALRLTAERCEHGEELLALERDRADFVRQSAAVLLRDVTRGRRDAEALARARDHDPSGAVAAESVARSPAPPDGVEPTVIVVIPAGEDVPKPAQPFALLRADGLVRLGTSDRRGQVFEVAAPRGALSLVESATAFE